MTSLMAWIGVDSRGPASIYLASDSRITWGNASTKWDCGRKLFASTKHPEILGYCGDVLFPSQVLGQLIDLIDADALFSKVDLPAEKWAKITEIVQTSFAQYPKNCRSDFTIVYCTRRSEGMNAAFSMFRLDWKKEKGWRDLGEMGLPSQSDLIGTFGSGEKAVTAWHTYWQNTSQAGTSRSMFGAFCDALVSKADPSSGGAPQLVGLYRQRPAISFGIIYEGQRYLLGIPVNDSIYRDGVEWRNKLFECCDWRTMKVKQNAQRHGRPSELAKP